MRILYLHYDHPNNPWLGGGGAKIVHEVSRCLAARHRITVVSGGWPGCPAGTTVEGVRYVFAPSGGCRTLSRMLYSVRAAARSLSAVSDVIVDALCAFSPTFAGVLARRPVVAALYLDPFSAAEKYSLLAPAVKALLRLNLGAYNTFVVNSPGLKDAVRRHLGPGVVVKVIPSGVDATFFCQTPEEHPYLLFLGRLDMNHKGLDTLVEAYKLVRRESPDVRLAVAGGGPDESKLRQLVRHAGLTDSVEMTGWVQGQKKADLLRCCLAVCLPSRREGWPVVANEAAACGKPVVGSDVPGMRDAVQDGETGLLTPSEDPEKLSRAMLTMIQDPQLRRQLGRNARRRVRSLSWEGTARQYEAFYEKVLAAHP